MDDKKKPWRRRNPFFDLFSDFDDFDELWENMLESMQDFDKVKPGKPLVYGFSMKMGPNGQPKIQEFGNIEARQERIGVKDAREPLVDVIEREKEVDVLAEMPGVKKEAIDVKVSGDFLTVTVPNEFYKEVTLPCDVDDQDIKAKYKNGVLTVTLRKKKPSKPAKRVKVE